MPPILAAGRPVVTQDTGFDHVLPTGAGLFAVKDIDDAVAAIEQIAAHPRRASRAAEEIARDHFDAGHVLSSLLDAVGVELTRKGKTAVKPTESQNGARPQHRPGGGPAGSDQSTHLHRDSTVLALIPHFKCEEYLDDCLAGLLAQTRPLDGIVVIDDASDDPPVSIVRRYPQVTLMSAAGTAGPTAWCSR